MMPNTIGMIYDQISEGTLPLSVKLETFNVKLNEILRLLKKRTDFEELTSIYCDMAACA